MDNLDKSTIVEDSKSGSKIRKSKLSVFEQSKAKRQYWKKVFDDLEKKVRKDMIDEIIGDDDFLSYNNREKPAKEKEAETEDDDKDEVESGCFCNDIDKHIQDVDLIVNIGGIRKMKHKAPKLSRIEKNPHHELLHRSLSVQMVSWKSKYKPVKIQMSEVESLELKAELLTKQIAEDFLEWYIGLGGSARDPEDTSWYLSKADDIVDVFQLWFNEHASRELVVDPKVMPCVTQDVADACNVPEKSCRNAVRRQIAKDIEAENEPKRMYGLGTQLPKHLRHVPPTNNTKERWTIIDTPTELQTMSLVWDDIHHLSSSKDFYAWLKNHPSKKIPTCMRKYYESKKDKKISYVVPSDQYQMLLEPGSDAAKKISLTKIEKFINQTIEKITKDT